MRDPNKFVSDWQVHLIKTINYEIMIRLLYLDSKILYISFVQDDIHQLHKLTNSNMKLTKYNKFNEV